MASFTASARKTPEQQVEAAYAICRGIARRRARNFYYGFAVLPREKRNAITAVYAFMRHCDDVADDPALAPSDRLLALNQYRSRMHEVLDGEPTDDPVLLALSDAQRRFKINRNLLDQLVTGTVMDVETPSSPENPIAPYQTFNDLRRYCYHVASVVGLVTIRIFGYRDAQAEPLAVDCGLAFQLTNILRDVKEDAMLGRVYLPIEDLALFNLGPGDVLNAIKDDTKILRLRPALEFEAERARSLYASAEKLLPLIDEDARPALWALQEIYSRLLARITEQQFNVFGEKISLSTSEKIGILARGFAQRFL